MNKCITMFIDFQKEEYRSLSPLVIVKKAHYHIILHRNQNDEKKVESKKKKHC